MSLSVAACDLSNAHCQYALLNDQTPPDPALAPLAFQLQITDVNSPATGSLVLIREMSGDRTGRVVFRAVASTAGNADGGSVPR